MNTLQLKDVMKRDRLGKESFLGVFPMDLLPKQEVLQRPFSLIVNTAPSSHKGQHWLAVYVDDEGQGEMFDSYGHSASFYDRRLEHFLQRNCMFHVYNSRQVQSFTSDVCGQFCLFFLLHRCRGIPADSIVNTFSKRTHQNDELVDHFIQKHFPFIKTYTKGNVKSLQKCKTRQQWLF